MKISERILVAAAMLMTIISGMGQRVTGTLPVVYINTENRQEITSKEEYLTADCWIDPLNTGYDAVGSASDPVLLNIRGRGNYTWVGFDKKPYKLKFDKKQAVLGMKKSKHFALLAHADDNLGFLRNTLGFELSRRLGLPWTPGQQPVELVLNGEYRGLYFLTENIRVDEDRVNIVEQKDGETDPAAITGGWLVEIDNYDSDPHVTIKDDGHRWGTDLFFTYKTPEVLSGEQEKYLTDQMQRLNDLFVAEDKSNARWTQYVDLDQLVRYYIVQEILDDAESFHGSCYLYKEIGENEKWKFGPVWDFGNSFRRGDSHLFIYQRPPYGQAWIGEIARFPEFQEKVKEVWKEFLENDYDGIKDFLKDFTTQISKGAESDFNRWPYYGNRNVNSKLDEFTGMLERRLKWLGEQWGTEYKEPVPDPGDKTIYLRGDFNFWGYSVPFTKGDDGLYRVHDVTIGESEFKISDEDWTLIDLGGNGDLIEMDAKYILHKIGQNIKPAESLEGVDFILDLTEPSLLIVKSEEVPQPDPEVTIYLRGDFNQWGVSHPFKKKEDGLYYITDISTGDSRFKVADAEWSELNFGSNGEKIYVNRPYSLLGGTNENIEPGLFLEHMDFIVDLAGPTLTIVETGTMGMGGITSAEEKVLDIEGRTVTAEGTIRVIDATGKLLQIGSDRLEVEAKGLLIIITENGAVKHIF